MLEPTGPLPPEVYWRRRAVALGVVVLAIVLVIVLIVWATSGGDNKTPQNASASGSVSASTTTQGSESMAPGSDASGGGSGSGAAGASGSASSGSAKPGTPASGESSQAPAPVPADGICPDQNLKVVLYTDKPNYTLGDQPEFTIAVTNAGLTACNRDVGKGVQNVTVRSLDGSVYIWSANDCGAVREVKNEALQPGQQVRDTISWSGNTSSPKCQLPRKPVAAGAYQATASLGEVASSPLTFNIYPGQN